MENVSEDKKNKVKVQVVPFFENIATYRQALMIANALKTRLNMYIIDAIAEYYLSEWKTELRYGSINELYDKLGQIAKKRNRSVSSAIEQCVKDYNEKKFKDMK